MTVSDRWLLPDGVEDILPPLAGRIESLRRDVMDTCQRWGYQLVIPPLIEYLESLFTGTGHDLELRTFKLTDRRRLPVSMPILWGRKALLACAMQAMSCTPARSTC